MFSAQAGQHIPLVNVSGVRWLACLCLDQLTPAEVLADHTNGQKGMVREEYKDRVGP